MTIVEHSGSVEYLHALPMPVADDAEGPQLWVLRPTGPAVVRGSAQKPDLFDGEYLQANGVELAGRRSGGAAVWIEPASVVWIDVLAPRGSPMWSDDLVQTFLGVGRRWQQALQTCGIESELVERAPERGGASDLACWAGLGWGEVVVGGAKVVGLSQRRTRWGARVQCMAVIDDTPQRVATAFSGLGDAERTAMFEAIGSVDLGVERESLERAAIDALLAGLESRS